MQDLPGYRHAFLLYSSFCMPRTPGIYKICLATGMLFYYILHFACRGRLRYTRFVRLPACFFAIFFILHAAVAGDMQDLPSYRHAFLLYSSFCMQRTPHIHSICSATGMLFYYILYFACRGRLRYTRFVRLPACFFAIFFILHAAVASDTLDLFGYRHTFLLYSSFCMPRWPRIYMICLANSMLFRYILYFACRGGLGYARFVWLPACFFAIFFILHAVVAWDTHDLPDLRHAFLPYSAFCMPQMPGIRMICLTSGMLFRYILYFACRECLGYA